MKINSLEYDAPLRLLRAYERGWITLTGNDRVVFGRVDSSCDWSSWVTLTRFGGWGGVGPLLLRFDTPNPGWTPQTRA